MTIATIIIAHFTDEETEMKSNRVTCKSQGQKVVREQSGSEDCALDYLQHLPFVGAINQCYLLLRARGN